MVSDNTDHPSLNLNIGSMEPCKTLRLSWHTGPDVYCYSINLCITNAMTKRGILSTISQFFDPLGLLAPYIIVMKTIIQKLWLCKLGWDDPLPFDIIIRSLVQCYTWITIIISITLSIPRIILCNSYKDIDLHIYSDASQTGLGACLYIRSKCRDDNVIIVLVRLLTVMILNC